MSSSVVLITGAGGDVARATALAFAHDKARLVLSDASGEAPESLVAQLNEMGAEAEYVAADVRRESDVRHLIAQTLIRYGRLDVAVNCAESRDRFGPVVDRSPDDYAATFDSVVLGTLLCLKHELQVMLVQSFGCVINVASSLRRMGIANMALCIASSSAIEGLTKCAAAECGSSGIRVNVVAAGSLPQSRRPANHGASEAVEPSTEAAAAIEGIGASHRLRRVRGGPLHERSDRSCRTQ